MQQAQVKATLNYTVWEGGAFLIFTTNTYTLQRIFGTFANSFGQKCTTDSKRPRTLIYSIQPRIKTDTGTK